MLANSLFIWGMLTRLLGVVLVIHFLSVLAQLRSLVGANGLEPAMLLFRAIKRDLGPALRFLRFPSLLLINSSDMALLLVCTSGLAASIGIVVGLGWWTKALFGVAWICWLSIQVSNPTVFSFPWDLLLSECTFFGIFLPPLAPLPYFQSISPPLPALSFYFSWLLFRVCFGMGLTRFKKRGETERDLSYIFHFLQWQPMPTMLAYYARNLPMWMHKVSLFFLFWSEVIVVFAIFGSPLFRLLAFFSIVALQLGIWATGNYGTFSVLTLVLCLPLLLPPPSMSSVFHFDVISMMLIAHTVLSLPSVLLANYWTNSLWLYQRKSLRELKFNQVIEAIAAVLRFLSPFRLINSYGVFRHQEIYVRDRLVMRLQGSQDGNTWQSYNTKFLSSEPKYRPRFFAPYHPRLDHFLFYGLAEAHSLKMFMFQACNPYYFHPFCLSEKLVQKLLRGDSVAESFFREGPVRPQMIRYALYKYTFTTLAEKSQTGDWWKIELLGTSAAIYRTETKNDFGIRETYDRFISESQSRGTFNKREFQDPRSNEMIGMHLHQVDRKAK